MIGNTLRTKNTKFSMVTFCFRVYYYSQMFDQYYIQLYVNFTGEKWLFTFYIFLAIKVWWVFYRINFMVFFSTFYFTYTFGIYNISITNRVRAIHLLNAVGMFEVFDWVLQPCLPSQSENWIELFLLLDGYCILWSWCSITIIDKLPLGRHMFWWHNQPSTLWIVLW